MRLVSKKAQLSQVDVEMTGTRQRPQSLTEGDTFRGLLTLHLEVEDLSREDVLTLRNLLLPTSAGVPPELSVEVDLVDL